MHERTTVHDTNSACSIQAVLQRNRPVLLRFCLSVACLSGPRRRNRPYPLSPSFPRQSPASPMSVDRWHVVAHPYETYVAVGDVCEWERWGLPRASAHNSQPIAHPCRGCRARCRFPCPPLFRPREFTHIRSKTHLALAPLGRWSGTDPCIGHPRAGKLPLPVPQFARSQGPSHLAFETLRRVRSAAAGA